jgi:hypothetical protein
MSVIHIHRFGYITKYHASPFLYNGKVIKKF